MLRCSQSNTSLTRQYVSLTRSTSFQRLNSTGLGRALQPRREIDYFAPQVICWALQAQHTGNDGSRGDTNSQTVRDLF